MCMKLKLKVDRKILKLKKVHLMVCQFQLLLLDYHLVDMKVFVMDYMKKNEL